MCTKAWAYLGIIIGCAIALFMIFGALLHTTQPLGDAFLGLIAVCLVARTIYDIDRNESKGNSN